MFNRQLTMVLKLLLALGSNCAGGDAGTFDQVGAAHLLARLSSAHRHHQSPLQLQLHRHPSL